MVYYNYDHGGRSCVEASVRGKAWEFLRAGCPARPGLVPILGTRSAYMTALSPALCPPPLKPASIGVLAIQSGKAAKFRSGEWLYAAG